ncbi:hypothetical protein EON65_53825 [archaeon]|nr:MAG: hypothetical protein EON65_53825 [archaeon]
MVESEADGKPSESTEPQTPAEKAAAVQERKSWWRTFFRFIYGGRSDKVEENVATMTEDSSTHRPKTPFTKLSSFKFRKVGLAWN